MKKVAIALSLLFFIFLAMVLKPVPTVSEDECLVEIGVLEDVYTTKNSDVFFKIRNNDRLFYVNRGTENGLNVEKIKSQFLQKNVIVKYPKYWTPLDPSHSIKHVAKVEVDGIVLYTEM